MTLGWELVTVQEGTPSRSPAGAVVLTWADIPAMTDIRARVIRSVEELPSAESTPVEEHWEVHLLGVWPDLGPMLRVRSASDLFDVRRIAYPVPFGTPVVVLETVRVTP